MCASGGGRSTRPPPRSHLSCSRARYVAADVGSLGLLRDTASGRASAVGRRRPPSRKVEEEEKEEEEVETAAALPRGGEGGIGGGVRAPGRAGPGRGGGGVEAGRPGPRGGRSHGRPACPPSARRTPRERRPAGRGASSTLDLVAFPEGRTREETGRGRRTGTETLERLLLTSFTPVASSRFGPPTPTEAAQRSFARAPAGASTGSATEGRAQRFAPASLRSLRSTPRPRPARSSRPGRRHLPRPSSARRPVQGPRLRRRRTRAAQTGAYGTGLTRHGGVRTVPGVALYGLGPRRSWS